MKLPSYLLKRLFWLLAGWLFVAGASAQKRSFDPLILFDKAGGGICYVSDELGNRVPDYSFCGYNLSETEIPWVEVKAFVSHHQGDATATIQDAIDYVSSLPVDADGFRGAVLLDRGTFSVGGSLRINACGVVLRGMGSDAGGTTLLGIGQIRDAVVYVEGKDDRTFGDPVDIVDEYVPVNASVLTVSDPSAFKPGDPVTVHRPSTEKWIKAVGCDEFGGGLYTMTWKPGDKDLFFDRRIESVDGNRLTLNIPLTNALEKEYTDATIQTYDWPGRIDRVGIEGIAFVSEYDLSNPKDEDHRWIAVSLDNIENGWIRQASFKHFAGSSVYILENGSQITVEDCVTSEPVSEIGGFRRNTYFTLGQQVLFQRCSSTHGYHDFAIGQCATGPIAFVQCESLFPYHFSGGVASWATGVLFDVVTIEGGLITMMNRGQDGNGAGWNMANSLLWNTTAAKIENYRPPTAQNWAMGPWAKYKGDGYWYEIDVHLQPRSLFYAQLEDRLGRKVDQRQSRLRPWVSEHQTTAPSIELAAELVRQAQEPALYMYQWIGLAEMPEEALQPGVAKVIARNDTPKAKPEILHPMTVVHGKLVRDNKLISGRVEETRYWNGNLNASWINMTPAHISRYVPGRNRHGMTDDLEALTDRMLEQNHVYINHIPGLWYDRRRDDHERFLREDGDVWAPFYEMPYARSGQGTAWDGLSKYDLTRFNVWYFDRLRSFVEQADLKGLLLIDQHYNQHNIIEAGAHWVDYPWRSANNINETGFPEPVPFAGEKRVYMAEQFYDVTNTHRMNLHRGHIRHHLENYSPQSGVIHSASSEYTGPAHFMAFWLRTVGEWQQESGKEVLVMLSATKDVQEEILSNPDLAAVVDVIDINFWFYRADGSLYAPEGGKNLAPRQHARLTPPGEASAASVYRSVREYRERYPEKAVIYRTEGFNQFGWAVLMAGGSLPEIPRVADPAFGQAAASMDYMSVTPDSDLWAIGGDAGYILAPQQDKSFTVSVQNGRYERVVIDKEEGKILSRKRLHVLKGTLDLPQTTQIVWLKRL